jgi:hypothetical protein
MATKSIIDWDKVEIEYRAGIRSLKDIGKQFSVSDAGIIKKAGKEGWTRDLRAKIKAKAEAKVSAAEVSAEVSVQKAANEQQVVEANAELQYRIRIEQRKDIGRSRKLVMSLLSELEGQTGSIDLLGQLAELMCEPDEKGQDKRNELFQKVISLSGRVSNMKALADSLKTLVALEREAFGIDDKRVLAATGDINISF